MAISSAYCANSQNKIGNFYITWGYHRDDYTKSTLHLKDNSTDNYNFTLDKAKAKDQPDMHDFFHTPLTVPQYVFNFGYFFANKQDWGVEFSWDHLKYIVIDNQVMHMHGDVRGKHIDTDTLVTPDFLHVEHTNGNNYAMINVVKRFPLMGGRFNRVYRLSILTKAGIGGLVPKTDSYVFGKHNDGPFRLSGFVIGASTSLRYDFYRYFYLEGSIKGAFADYTSAKLDGKGRLKHNFFSVQYIWSAGINIPLHK